MLKPITFVTYNTQFCTGLDGRTDVNRIVDEIGEADVICLQEIDRFWQRTGYVDQVTEITSLMPQYYWAFGPGIDLDASFHDTTNKLVNRRRQFGNMVLSRWPLLMVRNHLLPKLNLRTPLSLQRSALETIVDLPDGQCRVISIHLAHASADERLLQIEKLREIISEGAVDGGAWSGRDYHDSWGLDGPPNPSPRRGIVMGDFNSKPDSMEYSAICGGFNTTFGSLPTADGLIDIWTDMGHDRLKGPTWGEGPTASRLDLIMATTEIADCSGRIWVENKAKGSDHKPLFFEVTLCGKE